MLVSSSNRTCQYLSSDFQKSLLEPTVIESVRGGCAGPGWRAALASSG